jgi:hypothetical protein
MGSLGREQDKDHIAEPKFLGKPIHRSLQPQWNRSPAKPPPGLGGNDPKPVLSEQSHQIAAAQQVHMICNCASPPAAK